MKRSYSLFVAAALLASGAMAQNTTVRGNDAARQAMLLAKQAGGTSSHHVPPTDARGSNDECAGAVIMTVSASCSPVNADWTSATESQAPITCNGFTNANANDLWFTFTATTAYTAVEVTGGPDTDPIIEVFSGSCGSLTSEGCADATLVNETEVVNLPTNIGETYYYRTYWWDYGTAPTDYSFTTCVYEGIAPPPVPVNDDCSTITPEALNVGTPLVFTGTTLGATVTNDYAAGSLLDGQGPSVFHAFTLSECAAVTINYCGTDPAFGNAWIVIGTECPVNELIFNTSWNTTECPDGNITIYYDSLSAGTYYMPVLQDASANGPYTITLNAVATPGDCFTGVDEINAAGANWSVFPNPSNGDLTVQADQNLGLTTIEVIDLGGRVAYSEKVNLSNGQQHELRLAGQLSTGAYSVRLTSAMGRSEQRVMVR